MENCADKSVDGASDDRINGGDRISAGSEQNHVKSTAIVKYSAIQPAKFAQLQCNTDLNLPPANWLSSSVESYGFQHVLSNSGAFSSFRMAHMFPDCMGEVDVVSDAENVKKLLKIPYSRGSVSMMVHRIENTLLIDEFDIHKHLIRQAESDWVWLRKFFFEHVLQSLGDKDKGVTLRNHSRCALQQKYLTSKFLHYSLAETSGGSHTQKDRENRDAENRPSCSRNEPPLPEPRLEEELPDPATNKTFARNVVWTFEDIQMLLGTDMPIFGGSTHPCISLRLRDMTKPISVLTGIDYWLDNLMCNVPEVMMCYHLDGIVQRYELIKTEDLPHLSGSKFSPKLIRDVAQNILSFLKVNATKAGHTYWLFKSRDDDVVKLYDLTSLCSEGLIDKGQNPFTIPVAMLLYRVARNMKHNLPNSQPGTVRMLLKNCLSLLPKEKYPQIVTSAHYMLSDLYVPVTTDPACPGLSDENSDEEQARQNLEDEYENEETICATTNSVAVQSLANSPTSKVVDPPAPPMVGTIEDRCQMALQHVAAGLECLKYFEETSPKRGTDSSKSGEGGNETKHTPKPAEEVKYAHPFQAIPMPYAPISNEKKKGKKSRKGEVVKKEDENGGGDKNAEEMSLRALLCRPQADPLPTWQQPEGVDNAFWNTHLKTLLYEKAFLVYVTLAEQEYNCGNYGVALRYIHCVLRYTCNYFGKNCALISYLLGRAGDCCLLLAKNWPDIDRQFAGYTTKSEIDVEIEEAICKKSSPPLDDNEDCKLMPKVMDNVGQMLVVGCQFYSRALVLAPCDNLRRRLGNIHNEIGSYYMNQAATVQSTPPTNNEERQKYDNLFKAARSHLEQGVDQFESVSDNANLALLHSNTGRLMRLLAHYQQHCHHFDEEEDDDDKIALRVSKGEKYYYNRAFSSYQKALAFLGSRKSNPLIWDTINWELSSALFAYATMMQDYPPPITNRTREEVEREVVDLMQKALKYCDVDTTGPKQPMYQYRAGMLHYRLACLYHKTYRNLVADESNSRRKNVLQLCTMNYEKAARILLTIEHPSDYLRVQLERVALMEFQAENSNGALMKIKHYQYAISILVQCKQILNIMESSVNTQTTNEESDLEEKEKATEKNLLDLMENRLQFLLRTLVKLCITNPQLKLSESEAGYKACYNMLLKRKDGTTLVEHLISVLDSLNGVVAGH